MIELLFDETTFGITQASLKLLRDQITERFRHSITILRVETSGNICGFLIHDKTENVLIWSGDGFRTNSNDGEGGAGYRTAVAFLTMFNLGFMHVNFDELIQDCPELSKEFVDTKKFLETVWVKYKLSGLIYSIPEQQKAIYLRG